METREPVGETPGLDRDVYNPDKTRSFVVLKDVYALRRKIETGEGEVSPEEYHEVFSRALSSVEEDHELGRISSGQLAKELGELSRLQNEISTRVFLDLKQARIDGLTGLPTADFFNTQVQEMLDKQKEYVRDKEVEFLTMAILIDVNELKPINDRIGHAAGNVALRCVAEKIMANLRGGDPIKHQEKSVAGRMGGDEFVVVIDKVFSPSDDAEIISRFVDRIIKRFRREFSMITFEYEGEIYSVGATVGFAYTTDFVSQGPESLIKQADQDMYFHKPQKRRLI